MPLQNTHRPRHRWSSSIRQDTISDPLMNRIDLTLFVITKGMTKAEDRYDVKTTHIEVSERMCKRDAATAPNVRDRVPHVITKACIGAKVHERADDLIYVLENNIPIDAQYYLENQIRDPLLRIFEPILKKAREVLLQGNHTISKTIYPPSNIGTVKF